MILSEFTVVSGYEDGKQELYHERCGGYVFAIDDGDTLADLVDAAVSHRCPGDFPAQGGGTNTPDRVEDDPWWRKYAAETVMNHDTYREQTGEDA
jgi:hypothetical protein